MVEQVQIEKMVLIHDEVEVEVEVVVVEYYFLSMKLRHHYERQHIMDELDELTELEQLTEWLVELELTEY